MIKVDPKYYEVFYNDSKGNLQLGLGTGRDAQAAYHNAMQLSKTYYNVHICLGGEVIEQFNTNGIASP